MGFPIYPFHLKMDWNESNEWENRPSFIHLVIVTPTGDRYSNTNAGLHTYFKKEGVK